MTSEPRTQKEQHFEISRQLIRIQVKFVPSDIDISPRVELVPNKRHVIAINNSRAATATTIDPARVKRMTDPNRPLGTAARIAFATNHVLSS